MPWYSLKEMAKELGLQADLTDIGGIRSEIRQQLAPLHPDKNNGEFSSLEAKERFNKLTQALDFLDEKTNQSQALVSIDQVTAIIKAVNEGITPSREDKVSKLTNEYRMGRKTEIASAYKLPRLGSGIFAAICAAILTFSGSLKANPIFEPLVGSRSAQLFVLYAFFLCGFFFLLTWVRERRDEARSEWLLSEEGLRYVLRNVLDDSQRGGPVRFTLREWISEIRRLGKSPMPFLSPSKIGPSLAEQMAKIHLEELENRGVVKRDPASRLDIAYELQRDMSDEL